MPKISLVLFLVATCVTFCTCRHLSTDSSFEYPKIERNDTKRYTDFIEGNLKSARQNLEDAFKEFNSTIKDTSRIIDEIDLVMDVFKVNVSHPAFNYIAHYPFERFNNSRNNSEIDQKNDKKLLEKVFIDGRKFANCYAEVKNSTVESSNNLLKHLSDATKNLNIIERNFELCLPKLADNKTIWIGVLDCFFTEVQFFEGSHKDTPKTTMKLSEKFRKNAADLRNVKEACIKGTDWASFEEIQNFYAFAAIFFFHSGNI